jgi:hypothetical protein
MKKLFAFTVGVIVLLFMATETFAQEWTKDQTDVWKVVQDSWSKWKAGDIDGMAALFHNQYQGWDSEIPLPLDKTEVIAMYKELKTQENIESYSINPARIVITKTSAVVDYYFNFTMITTGKEKQEKTSVKGKNVEFYIKEDGKWLLLGDMTVEQK